MKDITVGALFGDEVVVESCGAGGADICVNCVCGYGGAVLYFTAEQASELIAAVRTAIQHANHGGQE